MKSRRTSGLATQPHQLYLHQSGRKWKRPHQLCKAYNYHDVRGYSDIYQCTIAMNNKPGEADRILWGHTPTPGRPKLHLLKYLHILGLFCVWFVGLCMWGVCGGVGVWWCGGGCVCVWVGVFVCVSGGCGCAIVVYSQILKRGYACVG